MSRAAVQARWLDLMRRDLPAPARMCGWPVSADRCFQRIPLDNAFGGVWYDHVAGRPAYAHADPAALEQAVALGEAAITGDAGLADLNRRSLDWRGKFLSQRRPCDPMSSTSQSRRTKIERTA